MDFHIFLDKFKPVCDKILKTPSCSNNITELAASIEATEPGYLQNVQQYILIPLINKLAIIDDYCLNKSETKIGLISLIELVIRKTELRNENAFKTISIALVKEVYDFKEAKLINQSSEELVLAVLKCLETSSKNLAPEVVETYFNATNSAQISQVLFAVLLILDESDYREIKQRAIDTILALLRVHDEADFDDIVIRNQVSAVVFFSLPKLWSSMTKIALGEKKLGKHLIGRAVTALGRIVCLIMEDERTIVEERELKLNDFNLLVANLTKTEDSEQPNPSKEILKSNPDSRSSDWLKAASIRLKSSFKQLISLAGNEHPFVRSEIGLCCLTWIKSCFNNLTDNIDTFVEIILVLSEDEDPENRNTFAIHFQELTRETRFHRVFQVSRDLIKRHVLRLPRIVCRQIEQEQILALSLLKAQIKRLPESEMLSLFTDRNFLDNFVYLILLCVELDYSNENLLKEEFSIRDYVASGWDVSVRTSWKQFKYINNQNSRSFRLITEICQNLDKSDISRIIIDYLMDLFNQRCLKMPEIVLVLNLLIKFTDDHELIEQTLAAFSEAEFWTLSFSTVVHDKDIESSRLVVSETVDGLYESGLQIRYIDVDQTPGQEENEAYLVSPKEAKMNVLFVCALMESFADASISLGQNRFQKYMFRMLSRILSNAGSRNVCIHSTAVFVLENLSKSHDLKGIDELIMHNSDYVIFYINQSLKHADQVNSSLDVISVVLQFCSENALGYLEMILCTLLDECAKYHHSSYLVSYLKVFGLFLRALKQEPTTVLEISNDVDSIISSWNEILEKAPEIMDNDNEGINKPVDDDLEEESPKPELPKRILLAKQIIEVSLKHISSNKSSNTIAALETILIGIDIVKDYEDELLPIVHQIWYPLAKKFTSDNPVILRNCFKLLISLGDSAKDFIQRRAVNEVIPVLHGILKSNSSRFLSASEDGIKFTQHFKLVEEILNSYHLLLSFLNVEGKAFDDALEAVCAYLNIKQPRVLSTAAKLFFQRLLPYDGAAVYQKLCSL